MPLKVKKNEVIFINSATCGIYKNGGPRYKIDPVSGHRTDVLDDELNEHTRALVEGVDPAGTIRVPLDKAWASRVFVPRYFDPRWNEPFYEMCASAGVQHVTLGALVDAGILYVRGGHGSPSNDKRTGRIPYVKVSDIRSLRVNVNPTNLVSETEAARHWRGDKSGIEAWDLVTPNRASSNIGEFAVFLPGETEVVITKEVFVLRVVQGADMGWTPFYLLWALCLKTVRRQWNRVTLMQTNREDVNSRFREIMVPVPPTPEWADLNSAPFRDYFTTLASARQEFRRGLHDSPWEFIASAASGSVVPPAEEQSDSDLDE